MTQTIIRILPPLRGSYEVGQQRTYPTINSVIDALYTVGVSGECEFVLIDTVYNERQ